MGVGVGNEGKNVGIMARGISAILLHSECASMPPHTKILARSASPSVDRGDRQAKGPRIALKDVLLCQFPDQAINFIEPFML